MRARPATHRLALQRAEAAEALGIGVDTFDRHVRPYVRCVHVGAVRLWSVRELQRWLDDNAHGMMRADNEKRPRTARTAGGMAHGGVAP
jgi:hypothetical protein